MTLFEILAFVSLMGVESGRWASMIDPPAELLQNVDFFSHLDMIDHLDLLEQTPPGRGSGR